MWIAVLLIGAAVVLVLLKFRGKDSYGHFKGLTMGQIMFGKGLIPHKYLAEIKEPLVKFETPVFTAVMAQDIDSAKFILSDQEAFPKTDLKGVANSVVHLMKNSIVIVNGDQWRRYRNVLSPPFHFDAVKQWIPDFYNLTVELMNHWKPITNKPIDITYWMPLFTLDVLGVTVLSRRFNSMNGEEESDLHAMKTMLDLVGMPSTFILGVLERWTGLNLNKKLNKSCEKIASALNDIIQSKRTQKSVEGKFDLVDVMVQAHDPKWTENELLCNALIMFSAGHETTSTALTWLFYHLTQNMPVQDKLVEEINRVLQGQPIKHEHMKDLTYLSKVIKENLRLQPPITTLFTRTVPHDVEYKGQIIPKGSSTGVNIYAIHHSPEYWENPEEFNPDRFDKPTIPFAFMPFSLKQRACLGNQFSLVEQTVFMTTFLQHFSIKSLDFVAPQTANNPILNQIPGLKVNIKSV